MPAGVHLRQVPPAGIPAAGGLRLPAYLRKLCDEGFVKRYGDRPEYRKQLDYELDMIEKMGFTDYFLIVSDFVRYAKSVTSR